MKKTICTLFLTSVAILPLNAYANAQTIGTQTTIATSSAQNLSQSDLNAIKSGALTNNGQAIPVETQIMMSIGNLDAYTIGKVQQSLSQRGLYKGAISGAWNNETATALQNFQQANGESIDTTGTMISSGTLASLGVSMDKLTAGDGARVAGNYGVGTATPTATSTMTTHAIANKGSYDPYTSSTVKTLGTVQMAANGDVPAGTYVSKTQMSPPGKTVAAPDNGSKSTLTRDAVASGRFNKTIDGSAARGTTDSVGMQNATSANNAIAGTRATPPVNSNNIANTPVAGSTSLSAGSTSSAHIQMTGSLTDSPSQPISSGSRYGNSLEPDNSTALSNAGIAPAAGGNATLGGASTPTGTLSNSGSVSATGSPSGIAGSTGSLSGDGRSANTSSLSGAGATAGSGSLSGSGGASGGLGGGGGGGGAGGGGL